ncbi:hypothetical protein GH733_019589 [Mirounga leonina]|nr:hypothetical protein GH733_019589 [Mirounga leonina]
MEQQVPPGCHLLDPRDWSAPDTPRLVASCVDALAIQEDRSRLEAGLGQEQSREIHASHFPCFLLSSPFFFDCSLLRRLVTLISQQATLLASNEAFKKQAESASEAAKKYMEENDQLKKEAAVGGVKLDGRDAEEKVEEENRSLKADLKKLKDELDINKQKLEKAENEVLAMRKQSEGLTKEYDRLLEEHAKLQVSRTCGLLCWRGSEPPPFPPPPPPPPPPPRTLAP